MWDCHNGRMRTPLDPVRLAAALEPPVLLLDAVGSTNDAIRAHLDRLPVLLATEHQQAGRGRAGHGWDTPRGAALTVSIALRPARPRESWGWLPLLTGLAVCRAVEHVTDLAPVLKWPNDVLLPDPTPVSGWGRYRKAVGILTEAVGDAVIVGIGINVDQHPAELPVPHAGSLRTAGAPEVDRTELLIAVAREVLTLVAGPRDIAVEHEVRERCVTLDAQIEAELPGGDRITGVATGIEADGSLRIQTATGPRVMTAGDLRHVRPRGELGSGE